MKLLTGDQQTDIFEKMLDQFFQIIIEFQESLYWISAMLYSQIILTITSEWNFCVQGSGIILGTNFALRNVWSPGPTGRVFNFVKHFEKRFFFASTTDLLLILMKFHVSTTKFLWFVMAYFEYNCILNYMFDSSIM